jgi:DNA-binding transcriptional MerR regulator
MLKIGDFSKLSRVSVKALRYYDDLGLLTPAQIDPLTGYRYYTVAQLPHLNRILAYKDLGFSLEQIKELLGEDLNKAQVRNLLRLKQVELQEHLRRDQARLARVKARLSQIEQEEFMPPYEIVVKVVEPQQVASVRGVIPSYDESEPIFDRLFDEVYGYVKRKGLRRAGCGIAVYHNPEGPDQDIAVEACAPVYEPLAASGRVQVYDLPRVEQMACVVHHGPFATITQAYQAVAGWIEANGYHITGPCREIYLRYERGSDQSQYVTEIQFPVTQN